MPPQWGQIHHIQDWILDGPTDLDNLILVCNSHHDDIHHGHLRVEGTASDLRVYDHTGRLVAHTTRHDPAEARSSGGDEVTRGDAGGEEVTRGDAGGEEAASGAGMRDADHENACCEANDDEVAAGRNRPAPSDRPDPRPPP
jgi:hypothetical protein